MIRLLHRRRTQPPPPPLPHQDPGADDDGAWIRDNFEEVKWGGRYWTGFTAPLQCTQVDPGCIDPAIHGPGPYPPLIAVLTEDGRPACIHDEHRGEHSTPVRAEQWALLTSGYSVRTWGGYIDRDSRQAIAVDFR